VSDASTADRDYDPFEHLDDEEAAPAQEMREMSSALNDDGTVDGTIVSKPREGSHSDRYVLTVETPYSEFSETFSKPTPPVADDEFTRIANEYGQGLADITALDGETVKTTYDDATDSWSIVVPKKPIRKRVGDGIAQLRRPYPTVPWIEDEDNKWPFGLVVFTTPVLFPIIVIESVFVDDMSPGATGMAHAVWAMIYWAIFIACLVGIGRLV